MDKKTYLKYKSKNNKNDGFSIKKFMYSVLIKSLVVIVLVLGSLIYIKSNTKNKEVFKKIVYAKNISFAKIYNIYQKYIGKVKTSNDGGVKVSSIKFSYNNVKKENNGYVFNTNDQIIYSIKSGIVVKKVKSEEYNNLITIQDKDGLEITYGYVNDINVKLYDYVKKDEIIGNISNKVYIKFFKDDKYLTYEEFL